ncbi:hypothetical protein M5W90_24925, partial [Paenibacillus thiaminolyticus]|nr:hypothetical protein [Paenibacillus thiaminolyticus]
AQMEQERGTKGKFRGGRDLESLAAEKGITVDELKAQMEQEREAKLEQLAAKKGMTVDELKAQMEKNHVARGIK